MHLFDLQLKDVPQLASLYVAVYKQAPWNEYWQLDWAEQRLETMMQSPGFLGLMYRTDQDIQGAILGRRNDYLGRKDLEIVDFFVTPEKQGAGIGSQLLNALQEQAKKANFSSCSLLSPKSITAYQFYLNKGFVENQDIVFMAHKL